MKRRIFTSVDSAVRKMSPHTLFWGIVATNVLLATLVAASTLIPRRARISIEAQTEFASVVLPAGQTSLAWGPMALDPTSIDALPTGCAEPFLDLSAPLEGELAVSLRIVPATDLLSITLSRQKGDVGMIECADGRQSGGGKSVRLLRPKNPERSLVLPFIGYLTVGSDMNEGTSSLSILRSGTVNTEASSFPFRNGAVRTETKLYAGDVVQVFDSSDNSRPAISHGIMMVGENGMIDVVSHSEAREAQIIHVGQEQATAASVAPTFWAKIQAQSEWTLLILAGAIILNIVGALHRYRAELQTGTAIGDGDL